MIRIPGDYFANPDILLITRSITLLLFARIVVVLPLFLVVAAAAKQLAKVSICGFNCRRRNFSFFLISR